ncbi:hypothetical protein CKAH01_03187 [Colletotrichum kahawae]|uniref:Uncharacterized protein n=1 Tax=Colletotrichum kahawae TaxID=34407 RepID=A0AAD9YSH2_COLKA|nr:hypothetical protein CKAH01_03187 [Colletotrichum kahawae]
MDDAFIGIHFLPQLARSPPSRTGSLFGHSSGATLVNGDTGVAHQVNRNTNVIVKSDNGTGKESSYSTLEYRQVPARD